MRTFLHLALAAVGALVVAPPVAAVSVGRFGGAQGCSCHGLAPTPSTEVTVEPEGPLVAGSEATLVVRIAETAIPAHRQNQQGGFNLVVAEGELVSLDTDVVRAEGREAGHRRLGNRQREWQVGWRVPESPSACALRVEAAALAANGDSSTTYDAWNRATVELPLEAIGDEDPPEVAFVKPAPGLTVGPLGASVPAPLTIHVGAPVELAVRASDASGIGSLELRDEDALGSSALEAPKFDAASGLFVLRWDTTKEPPGPHRLTVTASDCAGNGPARALLDVVIAL